MKKNADIIVRADYIWTGSRLIENGVISVKDGKIESILTAGDMEYTGHEIGGHFRFAMPAFINTHTHSAMTGMRGVADDLPLMKWLREYIFPIESSFVNRDFIKTFFPLALIEMIHSGIGTFADMYFFQQDAAVILKESGLRGVLGEGLSDYGTPNQKSPRDQLAYTEAFISNWASDAHVIPAVAPHAPYTCGADLLKKAGELSLKYHIPYLIHIAETEDEVESIRKEHGKSPVLYLDSIGVLNEFVVSAHSVYLTDEERNVFKQKNVGVSHNIESNLKLASGIAPIADYLEHGIKVSFGTDGAASNNNLDFIEEMRTASFAQKISSKNPSILGAEQALKIATHGGASVLNIEHVTGTLDVGKSADIVIFNMRKPHLLPLYNPVSQVVYAANAGDVESLIVMGKVIMENGEVKTLDEEKIIKNAITKGKKIKEYFDKS